MRQASHETTQRLCRWAIVAKVAQNTIFFHFFGHFPPHLVESDFTIGRGTHEENPAKTASLHSLEWIKYCNKGVCQILSLWPHFARVCPPYWPFCPGSGRFCLAFDGFIPACTFLIPQFLYDLEYGVRKFAFCLPIPPGIFLGSVYTRTFSVGCLRVRITCARTFALAGAVAEAAPGRRDAVCSPRRLTELPKNK